MNKNSANINEIKFQSIKSVKEMSVGDSIANHFTPREEVDVANNRL